MTDPISPLFIPRRGSRRYLWILAVLALSGALLACQALSSPLTQAPEATSIPAKPPTLTVKPSAVPTSTPVPSATPTSEPSPTLTQTPLPPTATPQPFIINDPAFQGDFNCTVDITITKISGDSFSVTFNAGSQIPIHNGKMSIWCWGAKQTWAGKLSYKGYTFDSSAADPLQFVILQNQGYVYLKGTGTVTSPDGKQVTLPPGGASSPASPSGGSTATLSAGGQPAASISPMPPMVSPACADFHQYDFSSETLIEANEEDWGKWGYDNSELFVRMKAADSWFYTTHDDMLDNVILEVDVRQAQPGPGKFGLIFGLPGGNSDNAYVFAINASGFLGLTHMQPSGDEDIRPLKESSFVLPGNATNHLSVMVSNRTVGITVNGFTSGSATFLEGFPALGYAGLAVWSFEKPGLEARFKNFSVCKPADAIPLPVYPLGNTRRTWPQNQPLYLETVWATKTAEQASAFAKLAETKLVIDGVAFKGLKEYWGKPVVMPDGFGIAWRLPLPALPAGLHRIELVRTISQDIDDGYSIVKAGEVSNGWVELEVK